MRRFTQLLLACAAVTALATLWIGTAQTAEAFHSDYSCASCHVPHAAFGDNSDVPLWNPAHTETVLTDFYTNPDGTLDATVGQVDGASKLCVSCHDGSYSHVSGEHTFGPATDGTNGMGMLATSHPVSFVYDAALFAADGELVDPSTLESDVLDGNEKMQCTGCHDIHVQAADPDRYLRWVPDYGARGRGVTSDGFCRKCHVK